MLGILKVITNALCHPHQRVSPMKKSPSPPPLCFTYFSTLPLWSYIPQIFFETLSFIPLRDKRAHFLLWTWLCNDFEGEQLPVVSYYKLWYKEECVVL